MQRQFLRYGSALLFASALALAGCSGDRGATGATGGQGDAGSPGADGTDGAPGQPGQDLTATAKPESCEVCHGGAGATHQGLYKAFTNGLNPATTKLVANIVGVESVANGDGTFTSTLTFTASLNGAPLTASQVTGLKQKRFTATAYDAATNTFTTATAISYDTKTLADGAGGQITITAAKAGFAPEAAGSNAFVYLYLGDKVLLPNLPTTAGRYNLLANVASAARVYGAIGYTSAANVSGCEKCHPAPYSKHGYRQATVAGLPDFVACKACHTDQAPGTDFVFQILADDPAAAAALTEDASGETVYSDAQKAKYAYRATVLNDTHMSHEMEFAYPQSMANCVTCHEGKLDRILADANFTITTCKSCHPVTNERGEGKAPALKNVVPHTSLDLYTYTGDCSYCHNAQTGFPRFRDIHPGYNKTIYASAGVKHSSAFQMAIGAVTYDAATKILTVPFTASGAAAQALVKPTVVISLYGYGTKDFIVSGHGSTGGLRNLEWTEGASNSARLTVAPAVATAGNTTWTATADLTTWADLITSGKVKRVEIGILPVVGLNQAQAVGAANPEIAVGGVTRTFDLVAGAVVADDKSYGKAIVNPAKCNKCHEALATTFHHPAYGSAGVVGCRLCHVVGSGGSHLEMQSRSIDSYVHAIHSFQAFDPGDIDFADPVAAMEYKHHIGSTYPNFTILNCESCHEMGKYEAPDQTLSLPSLLSAADPNGKNGSWDRTIGAVPVYVTGPVSRACGSCHRAQMINADDAGGLAAFNSHAASFGYMLEAPNDPATTDVNESTVALDAAIAEIFSIFR